jgi:hypothetical protein
MCFLFFILIRLIIQCCQPKVSDVTKYVRKASKKPSDSFYSDAVGCNVNMEQGSLMHLLSLNLTIMNACSWLPLSTELHEDDPQHVTTWCAIAINSATGFRITLCFPSAHSNFVVSSCYSESELCGGAVTVSFSKYLPLQAMNFLQRSTHCSKTCCRPFATSFRKRVEQV